MPVGLPETVEATADVRVQFSETLLVLGFAPFFRLRPWWFIRDSAGHTSSRLIDSDIRVEIGLLPEVLDAFDMDVQPGKTIFGNVEPRPIMAMTPPDAESTGGACRVGAPCLPGIRWARSG